MFVAVRTLQTSGQYNNGTSALVGDVATLGELPMDGGTGVTTGGIALMLQSLIFELELDFDFRNRLEYMQHVQQQQTQPNNGDWTRRRMQAQSSNGSTCECDPCPYTGPQPNFTEIGTIGGGDLAPTVPEGVCAPCAHQPTPRGALNSFRSSWT